MVKRRWLHEPALGRASLAEWGPLGAGGTGEACLPAAGRAGARGGGPWAGARLLLLGANVNDLAQAVPVATLAPGTLHRLADVPAYCWPVVKDGGADTQLTVRVLFREAQP